MEFLVRAIEAIRDDGCLAREAPRCFFAFGRWSAHGEIRARNPGAQGVAEQPAIQIHRGADAWIGSGSFGSDSAAEREAEDAHAFEIETLKEALVWSAIDHCESIEQVCDPVYDQAQLAVRPGDRFAEGRSR